MPPARRPNSDHDLLIEINTKLAASVSAGELLAVTLRERNVAFSDRFERLEREKAGYVDLDVLRRSIEEHSRNDKELFIDLGNKIDWTRKMIFLALGALTALEFIAGTWLIYILKR